MVESGNGRVLALRQVYSSNPGAAQAYRDWLSRQGVDVSRYQNPILVRQRTTPMTMDQRRAFTVAAAKRLAVKHRDFGLAKAAKPLHEQAEQALRTRQSVLQKQDSNLLSALKSAMA
jgi:ddrB-like ParB superfamily domain